MRLLAALAALTLIAPAAMAQPAQPYTVPQSMVIAVTSDSGERYEVMISWPEGAPPAAGWPVLYVLDGEDNFAIATLTARRLARAGARSGIGAGIVVGIAAGPLARRVRDYTPATPGWRIPAGQPAAGLDTGGAAAFLDLLERKIMPLVHDGRWSIDRNRETVLGHSFGGLLGLHAALTRPALFDAVVAVSPSLWFGEGLIAREAGKAKSNVRILIAESGEVVRNGAPESAEPAGLVAQLNRTGAPGQVRYLPLPGQSHGTTMLAAMVPAIDFAFGAGKR